MSVSSSTSTSRSSSPAPQLAYTRGANDESGLAPGQNPPSNPSASTQNNEPRAQINGTSRDLNETRLASSMNGLGFPEREKRENRSSAYPEPELDKSVEDVFSTVQVKNLTRSVTEAHLKEIFGSFGKVLCLDYPIELSAQRLTGAILHRGYAFIDFSSKEIHDKVIEEMDGAFIDGSQLEILSSNGQRSAMNLADREHYLRSAAVPGETISRFFQANYEYSRKGRMAKYEKFNRRGFNDRGYDDRFNGYNGRRFNDRFADRKKELPPDVYFPNKDKTFPRDNPYGRGDGYRDRMPYDRLPLRDDVYRPGKPYGQMRGSIHYQGGYDRFPDRGGYGRELRPYSPGPYGRRSPSPGYRYPRDLSRSPDYRRFSRSPPRRPLRSPSPPRLGGRLDSRSPPRFKRSPSPGLGMRIKSEFSKRSLSRSRSPVLRRGGGGRFSRSRSRSRSPFGKGRGRGGRMMSRSRSRSRSPIKRGGGGRGGRRFSSSRSPSPLAKLPSRKNHNSRSRNSRSRDSRSPPRKGRGGAPVRRNRRASLSRSRSRSRSPPKPRTGRKIFKSKSRSRSRSYSPPSRRRKLSRRSSSPPRGKRNAGGRNGGRRNRRSLSRSNSPVRRRSPVRYRR